MSACTCGSAARRGGTHRPDCPALNLVSALSAELGEDVGQTIAQLMGLSGEVVDLVSSAGEGRDLEAGVCISACLWAAVLMGRHYGKGSMTEDEIRKQLRHNLDVAISCIEDGERRGWFQTARVPRG